MKEINVLYGAYFSLKEIESLFNKIDVLDKVYDEKDVDWPYEVIQRIRKDEDRFTYTMHQYKEYKNAIYIYGINISEFKDEETWGNLKKTVESTLSKIFKKDIHCSILTIPEDDDGY
jgi:hypothetical protein